MRYMLLQDDNNPEADIKYYAVYEDNINVLVKIINENCEECTLGSCRVIDPNPPLPPCIQQQQP